MKRMVWVALIWLVILGLVACIYKLVVRPAKEAAVQQAVEEKKQQILTQTGATSRYDCKVEVAYDSFSGYGVFRTAEFSTELGRKRISGELADIPDYMERFQSVKSGKTKIALFTIDAFLKLCCETGEFGGTIVAIIDETRGADAMVAFKTAVPNVDALDDPDIKFILPPNSPSEMLVRVLRARFNLKRLSDSPFIEAKDAEDVYKRYRSADANAKQVFVLWQPYVSKVLENPNTHIVIDSSRFRGYIVDVVVCNRDFLYQNREAVTNFLEAYFRANYGYATQYVKLVLEDAKRQGVPLSDKQAQDLVDGVWWKNTQENYAHFGLGETGKIQHVEDIITNILKVLQSTGAVTKDPADGKVNLYYNTAVLADLKQRNFHPGIENVRDDTVVLPALTDAQWDDLSPVGTLEVPSLVFARGTDRLTDASQGVLDELIASLNTFPQYYVVIRGNASKEGDIQANKSLATSRAKAAEQYLIQRGVSEKRIKAVAVEPSGETRVDFILGQTPY